MSATGRRSKARAHVRRENDLYETPRETINAILPHLPLDGVILEPSAGRGAIVDALLDRGVATTQITAVEADMENASMIAAGVRVVTRDFLSFDEGDFDLVIGNPPYRDALGHVIHALSLLAPTGTLAMLLRLNWLASVHRADFHRKHPCDVYVLPRRPKFFGGTSDATEYMWALWGPGRGNRWFVL